MHNLALLVVGWALGLLSTVFASLLIRYLALRKRPEKQQAEAVTDSDICKLLLQVVSPIAVLALVVGFVLLVVTGPHTESPAARQADGTQTAEVFQQRESTAQAQTAGRRSTETAAALATGAYLDAAQTAIAALTEAAREPTPTPTPEAPTSTPEPPTSTPQPPTDTPRATDSPTPRPTRRPTRRPTTRPKPTNTPKPVNLWQGQVTGKAPNCDYTQIEGLAVDRGGGLVGDVWIHYWTDGWKGAWARSAAESSPSGLGGSSAKNWDAFISDYPRTGTWYVCVVADKGSWDCISNQLSVTTAAAPCGPGSSGVQIGYIVFRHN